MGKNDDGVRLLLAIAGSVAAVALAVGGIFYLSPKLVSRSNRLVGVAPTSSPSDLASGRTSPAAGGPDAVADAASTDDDKTTYSADFTIGRPPEFSRGTAQTTGDGNRTLLGRFAQQDVTFTLRDTPPHSMVRLIFDLAILNSWNGSSRYWGPDIWSCRVDKGVELCHATFCNCGFFSNNNEQSYPDEFPLPIGVASHTAWATAAEKQDLGEMRHFSNADPQLDEDCSSVYHMDWTFPHTDSQLTLHFQSTNKDNQMRWGLLSFYAQVLDHVTPATPDQLKSSWADLAGDDLVRANTAVWQLIAVGDQAVDFIQAQPNLMADPFKVPKERTLFASSAEFVGQFRLRQLAKLMI